MQSPDLFFIIGCVCSAVIGFLTALLLANHCGIGISFRSYERRTTTFFVLERLPATVLGTRPFVRIGFRWLRTEHQWQQHIVDTVAAIRKDPDAYDLADRLEQIWMQ